MHAGIYYGYSIVTYVTQINSHVSEPILLYLDENHEKMIPNNEILINDYFIHNNIQIRRDR